MSSIQKIKITRLFSDVFSFKLRLLLEKGDCFNVDFKGRMLKLTTREPPWEFGENFL